MNDPLHFTDHARTAAWHLIDHTPLGNSLRLFGHYEDTDGCLTVTLDAGSVAALSTGERALWDVLRALEPYGAEVGLYRLALALDEASKWATVTALAMSFGQPVARVMGRAS